MKESALEIPIPSHISDESGNAIQIESWISDLILAGATAAKYSTQIPENETWHLVISLPTIELSGNAFLFGYIGSQILHNPYFEPPKRISTDELAPGKVVSGRRRATSPEFPLGREFSGKVLSIEREIVPPRFTVRVDKKTTKQILLSYVTDLFELSYEGNEDNFLGYWDLTERKIEDTSPWEILLGVNKQDLSSFIEPRILMNSAANKFTEEKMINYHFCYGENNLSFPVSSIISQALPGKTHSNFIEINSTKHSSNSSFSNFDLHIMIGSRSVLENLDFSSQKLNVSFISRSENSVMPAVETLLDRRNSGFDIPLLNGFTPESASLEFLAFGKTK